MSIQLNTKIILGFLIAVGVLLLTSVASWYSMQQLGFYTRQVEHTYQVIQGTDELRMYLRDAQGQAPELPAAERLFLPARFPFRHS